MGCQLHAELQDQKSYHWNEQFLLAVIHIQDTVWLLLVAGHSNVLVITLARTTFALPLLKQNMIQLVDCQNIDCGLYI